MKVLGAVRVVVAFGFVVVVVASEGGDEGFGCDGVGGRGPRLRREGFCLDSWIRVVVFRRVWVAERM